MDRADKTGARRAMRPSADLLVVEDEEKVAEVVARMAISEGLTVVIAHTVSEAMLYLRSHSIRLAIVDWLLPDGLAALLVETLGAAGIDRLRYTGFDLDPLPDVPTIVKPGLEELREWMRQRGSAR